MITLPSIFVPSIPNLLSIPTRCVSEGMHGIRRSSLAYAADRPSLTQLIVPRLRSGLLLDRFEERIIEIDHTVACAV